MRHVLGSVALVALGIGGFHVAWTTRADARAHLALYASGTRVDGQVVDLRIRHRRRGDDFYVTYRFGTRGGEREVNRYEHAALRKGQAIAVWHDDARFTSEPERGYWNDQATWTPLFFAGAGAFLIVVAGVVLLQSRRSTP